ncbi:MAG TPA: phosphonate C-P lyase system protein PhnG [Burkholderiaceae bacterium]|nr:phosphonate C-P lyase system protein PhnG [Burkholderiaceae bacterium]
MTQTLRQRCHAVLARAACTELETAWQRLNAPRHAVVRAPEIGMVMLRGRIGGTGDPFNFGEATVTRCAVQLAGGALGLGCVLGRDPRKAELVAAFDALIQDETRAAEVQASVVEPLARAQAQAGEMASRAAASTKVEFFTLVRGEA